MLAGIALLQEQLLSFGTVPKMLGFGRWFGKRFWIDSHWSYLLESSKCIWIVKHEIIGRVIVSVLFYFVETARLLWSQFSLAAIQPLTPRLIELSCQDLCSHSGYRREHFAWPSHRLIYRYTDN